MFDQTVYGKIKQTNVSKDQDKTKERVEAIWKSCKKPVKNAVLELADVNDSSYYRIYQTGTISVKLALALAQIVNIDPYYLTGESDEQSEFSEELGKDFLKAKGYNDLVIEYERSKPKTRKRRKHIAEGEGIPAAAETANDLDDWNSEADDAYVVQEYDLPVNSDELPDKDTHKSSSAVKAVIDAFNASYATLTFDQMNCINNLAPDEVEILLKSKLIKAKADSEAIAALKVIKLLLLS
jgi:hypothetical protein